jgi:methionyl-tRNA formyltransferase
MRIIFIGAVEFSQRALSCLLDMKAHVVGVCTLQESAFNADHCDLSPLCEEYAVPWTYAPNINSAESIQWIKDRQPDVIFCFGWSRLLKQEILTLAPLGVIGFHPAGLPANRGRHPLIWALVLGLKETAVTFFFMDEGADSGDILAQQHIEISDDDNAASLYEKVTQNALTQIREFLPQLEVGTYLRIEQDHSVANTWRKRGQADGQIDWRMSAGTIYNLVRALTKPYVGAHFLYKDHIYKVWNSKIVSDTPLNFEPGKILEVDSQGIIVKCGEKGIQLLDIEPPFRPTIGEYL